MFSTNITWRGGVGMDILVIVCVNSIILLSCLCV